jgi:hypothetical protein
MATEPVARQPRHFVQCSRFFEQVRRSWHDRQLFFAAQLREGCPVQLKYLGVFFSDDQQRRSPDARQSRTGQVRTAAAGHNCAYRIGAERRCRERGGGSGAGTEIADRKIPGIGELGKPIGCVDEPFGEQVDVEP